MHIIEEALDQFANAAIFSVLNLKSAYYHIPLAANRRGVTALCTPFGQYEFNDLPIGIRVRAQALSRFVDELFGDLMGRYVFNFLDNLVVYSSLPEESVTNLQEVLSRFKRSGFTPNRDKVVLGASEIKYLCHLISVRGVKILPEKVTAMQDYPRPAILRSLRRFIGMVDFYARFIPSYGSVVAPLHELRKKGVSFCWRETHQAAFDSLKPAFTEAPVLQIPYYEEDFVLATDASDVAVSAFLQLDVNGELAPIAYQSRVLTPAERKYRSYEKECTAALFGCEKCRSFLQQKELLLHCDNLTLCWLLRKVKDVGCLARWILRLVQFQFKVQHTRGRDNVVADALSRMFIDVSEKNTQVSCDVLLDSLRLVYSSLAEHQAKDDFLCGHPAEGSGYAHWR